MIDKHKRLVGALLSLGVALAVCAFAARAPGHTLNGLLVNDAKLSGTWNGCSLPLQYWAQGIGYDIAMNPQCSANDAQGTTVHTSCPDSAVLHIARLVSAPCAPFLGC